MTISSTRVDKQDYVRMTRALGAAALSLICVVGLIVVTGTTAFAQATGGSIETDGNFTVHTFTSSGTFTVPDGLSLNDVDYLVVGGGGGGGVLAGGGGGGGGVVTGTEATVSAGMHSITVGAGGSGGECTGFDDSTRGESGGSSQFSTFASALGGGGGGSYNRSDFGLWSGQNGGSGGGASHDVNGIPGSGQPGQGYDGAAGTRGSGDSSGGGGGGAGGAGQAGTMTAAGNGGVGVSNSITGGSVFYGGGGGGGGDERGNTATPGAGGNGGGGAGGANGVNGFGGGGGGGPTYVSEIPCASGAGGSGVVIIRYDMKPTVAITGAPDSISGETAFDVTVTFSEDVTGFIAGDIIVANGYVTGLTGGLSTFTASVTATGGGVLSIFVPDNVATDGTGTGNIESNTLVIENRTVEETQKVAAEHMLNQANALLSNQPSLRGFMTRSGGDRSFNAQVTQGFGNFNYSSANESNIAWNTIGGDWTNDSQGRSRYVFGATGVHRFVTPDLIIGGMFQYDYLDRRSTRSTATIESTGWLAGPYVLSRHPTHDLYFEGRLLYGQTSNTISPFGTYRDNFTSTRGLVQFELSGRLERPNITWFPLIDISHLTDTQETYTDSLGSVIPSQSISLTQASLGMDIEVPVKVRSGALSLNGSIRGTYTQTNATGNATNVVSPFENGRARLEFGLDRTFANSSSLIGRINYDGIGQRDYEAYGLALQFFFDF